MVIETDGVDYYVHSQLTNEDMNQTDPIYSPDGKKIVYSSKEDGGKYSDIWIMDADGSNHKQLTNNDFSESYPYFNSDGTKIVYNELSSYRGHIWIVDDDGKSNEQLTNGSSWYVYPSFNPLNNSIIFASKGRLNTDWLDIWSMDKNGRNMVQLTDDDIHQSAPRYSPDGETILYTVYESQYTIKSSGQIWMMNKTGENRTMINEGGDFGCKDVHFHPDGDKVVYKMFDLTLSVGYSQIYIEDINGTGNERVMNISHNFYYPFIDPTGTKIVYSSFEDGGNYLDVWEIDLTKIVVPEDPKDDNTIINDTAPGNEPHPAMTMSTHLTRATSLQGTIPSTTAMAVMVPMMRCPQWRMKAAMIT